MTLVKGLCVCVGGGTAVSIPVRFVGFFGTVAAGCLSGDELVDKKDSRIGVQVRPVHLSSWNAEFPTEIYTMFNVLWWLTTITWNFWYFMQPPSLSAKFTTNTLEKALRWQNRLPCLDLIQNIVSFVNEQGVSFSVTCPVLQIFIYYTMQISPWAVDRNCLVSVAVIAVLR